MKKLVININELTYEKLRLEALRGKKDIPTVIKDRILEREFHPDIEEAIKEWMDKEIEGILKEP